MQQTHVRLSLVQPVGSVVGRPLHGQGVFVRCRALSGDADTSCVLRFACNSRRHWPGDKSATNHAQVGAVVEARRPVRGICE